MKVAHIAFECAPIYKTGGLGDVVGSLPIELVKKGIDTIVVMPGYEWIKKPQTLPQSQIPMVYIQSPWFAKPNVKHDPKVQAQKYAHFSLQTLEELKRRDFKPDIIHCHDWHAALIPFILKKMSDAFFENTKTLLTLHNISYQGNFQTDYLNHDLVKVILKYIKPHQKRISYLKLGIENADFISTVSANHAQEIRRGQFGFGLSGAIRKKRGKFVGIVNGIDYKIWNPKRDRRVMTRYSLNQALVGKQINKQVLQQKLGLEVDPGVPLFGFIARLTGQKGIDLMLSLLAQVAQKRMQVVLLGTGDQKYHKLLETYRKSEHKKWISINFAFDERLAHQIYAGSDFFLIPSHFEPCGLTQMISMAYGALPIASSVGGLKDTIETGKNGWLFTPVNSQEFEKSIQKALNVWADKRALSTMVHSAMRKDFTWKRSAREYAKLYHRIRHEI